MKKRIIRQVFGWAAIVLLSVSCERRPFDEPCTDSAIIEVTIDWSNSGIAVPDPSGVDYVHRTTLRFFPKDGSPAFERYLEMNISKGTIEVPVGEYSVVVYNESVYDPYWEDAIYFTNTDNYTLFAANVLPDDPNRHDYYTPLPNEKLVIEPFKLASWSLDHFKVTPEMIQSNQQQGITLSPDIVSQLNAFKNVPLRRLTYKVTALARVENMHSAHIIQGVMRGFSNKVYMASAKTEQNKTSHIFTFNSRKWSDDSKTNGTTEWSFLTFGQLPTPSEYELYVSPFLVTGDLYPPFLFDVTNQVISSLYPHIYIQVEFDLPIVKDGIDVGDWDDEDHILN